MARDESRSLWVGRLKNDSRLFFASTSGILVEGIQAALRDRVAFELLVPLAPNYIYSASSSGVFGAVFEDEIRQKGCKFRIAFGFHPGPFDISSFRCRV